MGCGKGGTFSLTPDWNQWAIMVSTPKEIPATGSLNEVLQTTFGSFIPAYWKRFNCNVTAYLLQPIEGHGTWDRKECFGTLPRNTEYEGRIAVLTRATIRITKLKAFWSKVEGASQSMLEAPGYETSIGIGEVPWIKQATFSIWTSKAAMKDYAYRTHVHKEVIGKTRTENWYSEEMFVRFRILAEYHQQRLA